MTALFRMSYTMLNKSVKSKHLCFVPNLRGKVFSLSIFSIIDVRLYYMTFIILSFCPILSFFFLIFCYKMCVGFCKIPILFMHQLGWFCFFSFHCVAQLWGYHTGLYKNYNILLTSLVFLGSDPHGFLCRDVLSSGLHKLKHFKETERILGWYLFW